MNAPQPERYHALTRSERDHLLAVVTCDESQPSGMDINRRVEQLRGGEGTSANTTYAALDRLAGWDLLAKETIDGKTTAYEATTTGLELLSQAVAENPA